MARSGTLPACLIYCGTPHPADERSTPRGMTLYLKEQHSLREIALRLAQAGHFPKRGGQWYPQTVKLLMVS